MLEIFNTALTIIGTAVGIAGFAYGFYQNSLRERIQRMNRARSWEFFRVMYSTFASLQDYYQRKQPLPQRHPDMDAAMAQMQVLYPRSIENVLAQYEQLTPEMIDEWHRRRQVPDTAVTLFKIKLHDQEAEAPNDALQRTGSAVTAPASSPPPSPTRHGGATPAPPVAEL